MSRACYAKCPENLAEIENQGTVVRSPISANPAWIKFSPAVFVYAFLDDCFVEDLTK